MIVLAWETARILFPYPITALAVFGRLAVFSDSRQQLERHARLNDHTYTHLKNDGLVFHLTQHLAGAEK